VISHLVSLLLYYCSVADQLVSMLAYISRWMVHQSVVHQSVDGTSVGGTSVGGWYISRWMVHQSVDGTSVGGTSVGGTSVGGWYISRWMVHQWQLLLQDEGSERVPGRCVGRGGAGGGGVRGSCAWE
jgi:hypothetical protein